MAPTVLDPAGGAQRPGGMERRAFGSVPREVPVIGQGTWFIDDAHRPTAVAALRRGIDLGMTHIDTAEMYGDAEAVVGEAIADLRDEVFLVSKVVPSNASFRGTIAACERSLARLHTDRLLPTRAAEGSYLDESARGNRPRWSMAAYVPAMGEV